MELSTYTLIVLTVLGCVYIVLDHYFGVHHDEKEPPLLPSSIPWFGHFLGLMRHRTQYMLRLRKHSTMPIYTLPMPAGKLDVINTPQLITAVMRNSKTLLFGPFAAKNHRRLFGISAAAEKIAQDNVDLSKGQWGLWHEAVSASHVAFNPGQGLDELNSKMIAGLNNTFANLEQQAPHSPCEVGLLDWLRQELTSVITAASYGPTNPFTDSKVTQGFWDFQENMMMVFANIYPTITCPEAYNGRETTIKALTRFFAAGGQHTAGHLVRGIHQYTAKYGLSHEDMARFELATVIAMLVNTIPSAFWFIYYIYKDPALVAKLRAEVGKVIIERENEEGIRTRIIRANDLKTACPRLNSTWLEVLRYHANGSSFREVTIDTILDGKYLLKKGNVVQMPAIVIHNDISVWGENAGSFEADRHLAQFQGIGSDDGHKRLPKDYRQASRQTVPGAFRAFGGGQTLCPGRHFVTTELLSLIAMMIMRFDIVPVIAGGGWPELGWNDKDMSAAITHPSSDVKVTISKLEEETVRGLWKIAE